MLHLFILVLAARGSLYTPEQVHISWTDAVTSISVTWAAEAPTTGASVQYTPISSYNQKVNSYTYSSPGVWTSFPNTAYPAILQRHLNVCKAYMTNLTQGGLYAYRVGSNVSGWSPQFNFQAKRNFTDSTIARFMVYGDFILGIRTSLLCADSKKRCTHTSMTRLFITATSPMILMMITEEWGTPL